jgi:hypothetical protein
VAERCVNDNAGQQWSFDADKRFKNDKGGCHDVHREDGRTRADLRMRRLAGTGVGRRHGTRSVVGATERVRWRRRWWGGRW